MKAKAKPKPRFFSIAVLSLPGQIKCQMSPLANKRRTTVVLEDFRPQEVAVSLLLLACVVQNRPKCFLVCLSLACLGKIGSLSSV